MAGDSLLQILRRLECELHEHGARSNHQRLLELLHPEFVEFGRSGKAYTRADILTILIQERRPTPVHAQDFCAQVLSEGVVLLTYKSAHVIGAGLERHTLRASLWRHSAAGWQMVFHQGTPTEPVAKNET